MKKKSPFTTPFNDTIVNRIKNDPKFAFEIVKLTLEEATDKEGRKILSTTLKQLVEVQGIRNIAKSVGMPIKNLSKKDPELFILHAITSAFGFKLTLTHSI